MREIALSPTKSFNDRIEVNEPVRVYDTSGPWGDPDYDGTVEEGLPPLRREWILTRGDVYECDGRKVKPLDDGYLSEIHQAHAAKRQDPTNLKLETRNLKLRRPLRASAGHPITQLWYARQGIITPEMEFIAIRENMRVAQVSRLRIGDLARDPVRNDLNKQHAGPGSPNHDSTIDDSTIQRFNDSTPS